MTIEANEQVEQGGGTDERARPHWRRWVLISLGVIGVIVGPIGTWLLYVWQTGKAEVARAIAETDALYPHWRWEDLLAQREPLDPAEDAWPIIAALTGRYHGHPRHREVDGSQPGSIWHWLTREASHHPYQQLPPHFVAVLEQWRAADPFIEQLAMSLLSYRRARVPVPPLALNPITTSLPDHQELRTAMDGLRLLHEWYLTQRDYASAEAVLRAQWVVVSAFDDDPFLIGQLVGCAIERRAVALLERHLALCDLSEPTRRQLAVELERFAARNRFLLGIRGERAAWQAAYENILSGKLAWREFTAETFGAPHMSPNWWEQVPTRFISDASRYLAYLHYPHTHATSLRWLNNLEEFAKLPLEQQVLPHNLAVFEPPEYPKAAHLGGIPWYSCVVSRSYLRTWDAFRTSRAVLQAARAALAAEEFRLRHGRLPTGWDEIVPEFLAQVPLDPFDGNPMRFISTTEGIVIYSIGRNGTDDGGRIAEDRDVGFRLYHRRYRGLPLSPAKPATP